ncbi:hypothetical protein Pla52o_14850 [Novipirellula galeiformis]|uniref:Uncharacterized protein n=1 Tax=Novipirellula galeiformis TaxID=2528004 RepID=A0A5C6CNJ9_9BACT|nr:hypothetical protein [Novipirellula galeiformis]TWU25187.1 hypothetical protein Pla52o_14850 [Novipirellula galeiformis]
MAWRPEHLVTSGQLDNTLNGWTIGWLELDGIDERLQLKLAGNCHPDLAGWKFRIHRTAPDPPKHFGSDEPPDYSLLSRDQSGHVGDITADQMIKHFELSIDELGQRLREGEKPPFQWRRCLYLEWYSNHNGRVVIQSTRLEVERLGQRAFELTATEWREQAYRNSEEMDHFLMQLDDAIEDSPPESEDA